MTQNCYQMTMTNQRKRVQRNLDPWRQEGARGFASSEQCSASAEDGEEGRPFVHS